MNPTEVKAEVIARLKDMLAQVERNDLCGLESIVSELDKEDCLNRATDSLASGDILATIIFDTCDRM